MRALKQTGSRNIEAALEYISKMGYLDPRNELIVRVIKQTSPGTYNLNGLTLTSEILSAVVDLMAVSVLNVCS